MFVGIIFIRDFVCIFPVDFVGFMLDIVQGIIRYCRNIFNAFFFFGQGLEVTDSKGS